MTSEFRQVVERLAIAVVAASTIVLAAGSDLAAGPRRLQFVLLVLLLISGICLGVVTYLAIDGLQRANLQLRDNVSALAVQLEQEVVRGREKLLASRLERRLRRLLTAGLSELPSGSSDLRVAWRIGIWSVDSDSWMLKPLLSGDCPPLAVWDRPALRVLPEETAAAELGESRRCCEVAVAIKGMGSQTFYCTMQILYVGNSGLAPQARLIIRKLANIVVQSDDFMEDLLEYSHP